MRACVRVHGSGAGNPGGEGGRPSVSSPPSRAQPPPPPAVSSCSRQMAQPWQAWSSALWSAQPACDSRTASTAVPHKISTARSEPCTCNGKSKWTEVDRLPRTCACTPCAHAYARTLCCISPSRRLSTNEPCFAPPYVALCCTIIQHAVPCCTMLLSSRRCTSPLFASSSSAFASCFSSATSSSRFCMSALHEMPPEVLHCPCPNHSVVLYCHP